jgi:integrase
MTKSGNNEGSIYQRGSRSHAAGADGRWCAVVTLPDGRRKYLYAKTRAAAAQRLREALRSLDEGTLSGDREQPLARFLETWLTETVKPNRRPMTYRSYEVLTRRHIIPTLGRVPLSKVSPPQIQQLLNRKLEEGLSPRTVFYIRSVLRIALGRAVKWGLITRNAAALVDPPKVPRREILPLSPDEARTFLSAVRGDPREPIYVLAITTGLRQGELLGLGWDDIDLDRKELRVRRGLQRVSGHLIFVEPKTSGSRRAVSLTSLAVEALLAQRARQRELRLLAGSRWRDGGLVFTTGIGTPLEPRNVLRDFQLALERAGLARRRFHDLRHSFASLLLAQGASPRVVMEMLGHSSIALTMNTYSHVSGALQEDAALRLDELLRRSS